MFSPLVVFLVLAACLLTVRSVEEDPDDRVIDLQELLKAVSSSLDKLALFADKFALMGDQFKDLQNTIAELPPCMSCKESSTTPKESTPATTPRPLNHPADCLAVLKSGQKKSGVYRIKPEGWMIQEGFEVFCDMDTDGGGWTVFQRRGDFGNPQDYFFKTWAEYKEGFGDLQKEFWLGNDHISALTNQKTTGCELRVDLAELDKNLAFAKYREFRVKDEAKQYQVYVVGYSGTAGDSMSYNNNVRFSTKDRDNDNHPSLHCARDQHKGAWWHNQCTQANLNGLNLRTQNTGDSQGIFWYHWKTSYYHSLAFTEMKLRQRE